MSGCGVLNANPLILHGWWWQGSPFRVIEAISRELAKTPFVLLVSNAWSLFARDRDGSEVRDVIREYRLHKSLFPDHSIVFLANDAMEQAMLGDHGVESFVFQHNGFYNSEKIPFMRQPKEFDSVYMARIHSYKRFELMADIETACILFGDVEMPYYKEVAGLLKRFTFVNGDPRSDNIAWLTSPEVAQWCARSRCGLCLSAEEGAMFSSMEYLLSGIPIVSTRSIGGRDAYFDDQYCIVCDDTPAAVARAVKEIAARDIDPAYIRMSTLARIMENRVGLLRYIMKSIPAKGRSFDSFARCLLDIGHQYDFRRSRTVRSLLDEIRDCGIGMSAAPSAK
jgi:glycosyltransferase involved in cell wall biosynthesis